MNGDFKPGDVVLVEAGCWASRKVAIRLAEGWAHANGANVDDDGVVTPVRRLVVIDLPKGALGGWDVLIGALEAAKEKTGLTMVFTGLIEQIKAQAPLKPDEPTGLGAVVEDTEGGHWVLYTSRLSTSPWCDGATSCEWEDIAAVRVLSEGVHP